MVRLDEVTRKELLDKMKMETPERYARRMNYISSMKPLPMAKDLFLNTGTLTVPMQIGDYIVTIHISGILKEINDEMVAQHKDLPDRALTYKALRNAVDKSNIYVNCECGDFRYRHAYHATIQDFKYGSPERRPANITNPNNKGSVCKHIAVALVRPSQWLKYVAGWICTIIRAYIINRRSEMTPEESINDLEKEREVKSPEEIKTGSNQNEPENTENEENETGTENIPDSDLEVKEEDIEV